MANIHLKDFAPIEGVHFLGNKTLRGDILSRPPLACACCGKKDGRNRCANCFSYAYCSKECQVEHWTQHKQACRDIKGFLDLEAMIMDLCSDPFILHHLRTGIAIALDLVDPDPPSDDEKAKLREACRVVPIKLTIHPLSEADTLAFAIGKRTVENKGPGSKVPGFVALHSMESDEVVGNVPEVDKGDDGEEGADTEPRVLMSGAKPKEVDREDKKRYRALWKQVREKQDADRAARTPEEKARFEYEFDPDPIVLVDFEYETHRSTIALEITPEAMETALCECLSDEDERMLEKLDVQVPEDWQLFDMIVMINAYILADKADKLKLRRMLRRSDAQFLKDYMLTRAGR